MPVVTPMGNDKTAFTHTGRGGDPSAPSTRTSPSSPLSSGKPLTTPHHSSGPVSPSQAGTAKHNRQLHPVAFATPDRDAGPNAMSSGAVIMGMTAKALGTSQHPVSGKTPRPSGGSGVDRARPSSVTPQEQTPSSSWGGGPSANSTERHDGGIAGDSPLSHQRDAPPSPTLPVSLRVPLAAPPSSENRMMTRTRFRKENNVFACGEEDAGHGKCRESRSEMDPSASASNKNNREGSGDSGTERTELPSGNGRSAPNDKVKFEDNDDDDDRMRNSINIFAEPVADEKKRDDQQKESGPKEMSVAEIVASSSSLSSPSSSQSGKRGVVSRRGGRYGAASPARCGGSVGSTSSPAHESNEMGTDSNEKVGGGAYPFETYDGAARSGAALESGLDSSPGAQKAVPRRASFARKPMLQPRSISIGSSSSFHSQLARHSAMHKSERGSTPQAAENDTVHSMCSPASGGLQNFPGYMENERKNRDNGRTSSASAYNARESDCDDSTRRKGQAQKGGDNPGLARRESYDDRENSTETPRDDDENYSNGKRKPFSITCNKSAVDSTIPLHLLHDTDSPQKRRGAANGSKEDASVPPPSPASKGRTTPTPSGADSKEQQEKQNCGRRNVTFSPPPPPPDSAFLDRKKTPTRSPTGGFLSLQSPGGIFLSPYLNSPSAYGIIGDSPSFERAVESVRREKEAELKDASDGPSDSEDSKKDENKGSEDPPEGVKSSSEQSEKSREQDREKTVATPTNFTTDYGKGHKLSASFDASNVFAWLHSPSAPSLFSPGGLGSALNTPRGIYGNPFGPRTPRTPRSPSSFFFTDLGDTPRNVEFTSPKPQANTEESGSERGASAGLSNMICISPLASSKRGKANSGGTARTSNQQDRDDGDSQSNTPMYYKGVFESPRLPMARSGETNGPKPGKPRSMPLLGDATPSRKVKASDSRGSKDKDSQNDPSLDVNMSRRDIMEDDDLSVLLQLASTATPRAGTGASKGASGENNSGTTVFRSPRGQNSQQYGHNAYDSSGSAPASLQLPVISTHGGDGSTSKLSRKAAFRDPHYSQESDFTPPPLAIRSTSSGGSREVVLAPGPASANHEDNDPSNENGKTGGAKKVSAMKSPSRSKAENKVSDKGDGKQTTLNVKRKKASNQSSAAADAVLSSGTSKKSNQKSSNKIASGSHSSYPPAGVFQEEKDKQMASSGQAPSVPYYPIPGSSVPPHIISHGGAMRSGPGPMNVPSSSVAGKSTTPHRMPAGASYPMPPTASSQKPPKGSYGGAPHPTSMNMGRPHPHSLYAHHHHHMPPPHMSTMGGPPPYHAHYHPHHPHPHHHMPMYPGQGGPKPAAASEEAQAQDKKAKSSKGSASKRSSSSPPGSGTEGSPCKKSKKSSTKSGSKKSKTAAATAAAAAAAALNNPVDRQKSAAAIAAVNAASGGKNDRAAALAAAILRGVTMRPSGKWQAQLYYAGKSRYIGVFDTREKAALAYEIAREKLKSDNRSPADQSAQCQKATEAAVNSARKAAFEGVNEQDRLSSK